MRRPRPVDDPRFGKAEPCDCVLDEATDVRRERLERLSNLGSLTRFSFATLIPSGRDGTNEWFPGALETARLFAADPQGWLVFTGSSGSGKTHLAAGIANDRIARGQYALFMVVPDLLDRLRASYDAGEDDLDYTQLFEQVRNAPLLILDDVDAPAGTPWAKEKLFQIINHRYNAELPTVFTTTTRPQELGDRLTTRLCDEELARVLILEGRPRGAYRQIGGMSREKLAEMQFRNFDLRRPGLTSEQRDSLEFAFRAAMSFADEPTGWITLMGPNGCGKTHLASAISNKVLAAGRSVFFAVVPDLLDDLRSSFAPEAETGYHELFEEVRTAELLVLDDLGAQRSAQWAEEKLYQIVNYRTLMGLPTIVTTDQAIDKLQAAYPRVVARIGDARNGIVVGILAGHYRMPSVRPAGAATIPRTRR